MKVSQKPRILAVVSSPRLLKQIKKESSSLNVRLEVIDCVFEVAQHAMKNKYNAILFETSVLSKIKTEDRPMVDRFREIFLFARIQITPGEKTVTFFTEKLLSDVNFGVFLGLASKEEPRQFRAQVRKPICFNLKVSRLKDVADSIKTHTINVSEGGCFIYTNLDLKKGAKLKVVFDELSDKTPIICRVVWRTKGGHDFRVAGVGVYFEEITEKQKGEIKLILSYH